MIPISNYLEQLELLPLESKIYLTLLETGSLTARELTQKLGVNRTTVYPPIDALIEKELIIKLVKERKTQFAVTNPEHSLPALLDKVVAKKTQEVKNLQEVFPSIMKNLKKPYPQQKDIEEAEIRYYKGKNGVKKIYEEVFRAKEVRSYYNMVYIEEALPENMALFDDAIKNNKNIMMYELLEDTPEAREHLSVHDQDDRFYYKFLPKHIKMANTDVLLYDGKVSIINLKDNVSGVVLHNQDLFASFKQLFDFLWEMLPE